MPCENARFEAKQTVPCENARFNGGRESEEGEGEGAAAHAVPRRNLLPQIEGAAHSQEPLARRLHRAEIWRQTHRRRPRDRSRYRKPHQEASRSRQEGRRRRDRSPHGSRTPATVPGHPSLQPPHGMKTKCNFTFSVFQFSVVRKINSTVKSQFFSQ